MARQYKLRLRDGTVLAVDHGGLRTWLIDDKAMVQPMGSRVWRPLREVLAQESVTVHAPRHEPHPQARTIADEDIPLIPVKPLVEAATPRVPLTPPPRPAPPPPPPPAAPAPKSAAPSAPAPRPAAPPRAPARPPARAAAPLVPEAPPQPAPPSLADLPIIPFKAPDPEPPPRVRVSAAAPPPAFDETDLGAELALVIQREVAEGKAVIIDESELEEIVIVEDDEAPGARPPAGKLVADTVSAWTTWLAPRAQKALSAVRMGAAAAIAKVAAARRRAAATRAAAPAPRREPLQAPPSLGDMPALRLAGDKARRGLRAGRNLLDAVRPRLKRAAPLAVLVAVAVVAAATSSLWMPLLKGLGSSPSPPAAGPDPAASPTLDPSLPREVVAAIQQMPHLAPETVQLVVATSPFAGPEPPDVFRRARAALRRGASALTPDEVQELAGLERAVLSRLRPIERERVEAYDRVTTGRELLSGEDARVLGLYARGARGLPPASRDRLQALSAKAIGAALRPVKPAGPGGAQIR
jgi:hypothetical protein